MADDDTIDLSTGAPSEVSAQVNVSASSPVGSPGVQDDSRNVQVPSEVGYWGSPLVPKYTKIRKQQSLDTPVQITDADQYEKLPSGQKYVDPDGTARQKPFAISDEFDYNNVPEGAPYIDPEGTNRVKPKFEGLGYTAQTLHSMAVTPKEQRRVLERFYPGQVQGEDGDLYVIDENGTYRKPGRLNTVRDALGAAAGNAAPMFGGVVGGLGGGAVGLETGPGAALSAAGGAAAGTMGGQYFNDIILKLTGIYDRTPSEELGDKAMGGAVGALGEFGGRGVGALITAPKVGASALKTAAPDIANKFLGTNAEDVARFRRLSELGEKPAEHPILKSLGMTESDTTPGISTVAKESPHLQNVQELFHEGFDTSQPRKQAAEAAYNELGQPLMEKQGVKGVDDLLSPEPKTSVKETGEKVISRALQDSGNIDAAFAERLAEGRRALAEQGQVLPAQREAIGQAAQAQHANATALVDAALTDVERGANQAVQAAAEGSNSGDLWQRVGQQLLTVKRAIGERFRQNAQAAYQTVPEGVGVNVRPLADSAADFIDAMPAELRTRNPGLVRQIEQIGQRVDEEGNAVPARVTLEQLHNIRTALRSSADYYDLPSDFKNGAMKLFASRVDDLMQGLSTAPQFRTAMELLNQNDRWYAQEIPVFNARQLQTIVRGLEAGEPADPQLLFQALVKPGTTDLIARTEQVVGPNLWNGVRGAQRLSWLQKARVGQFDGSVDALKFAREVIDAHNEGTLMSVQGREQGEQLLRQAQQIAALEGKLPLNFNPNDTALDVFRQARAAMEQSERQAAVDPLAALGRETNRLRVQLRGEENAVRSKDPLNFLADANYGAIRAVDKILGDEDLTLAVANRWGEHSPEFDALRQVWTERIFRGTLEPGKRLDKVSPEVQKLMLGTNLDTAKKIAEDMEFIVGAKALGHGDKTAGGMSVMAKVENPFGGSKIVSGAMRAVPGANTGMRATLGAYYSFMNKVLESPSLARFLEKSYANPEARQGIRTQLAKHLQQAGAVGGAVAQGLYRKQEQGLSLPQ